MKLSCKVIEDMLPMYYDKVCSADTAALVEEHLRNCPNCSRVLTELRGDIEIPIEKPDDIRPLKKLQKSYKKMKFRWLIAAILIVALLPVAFLFGSKQSEQAKQADPLTEEGALAMGNSFMSALVDGNYEEAFSYIDLNVKKRQYLSDTRIYEYNLTNLKEDALKAFMNAGKELDALGDITEYTNVDVQLSGYYDGNEYYVIKYIVKFNGENVTFDLSLTKEGIRSIVAAEGLIDHPLSKIALWGNVLWNKYLEEYYAKNPHDSTWREE